MIQNFVVINPYHEEEIQLYKNKIVDQETIDYFEEIKNNCEDCIDIPSSPFKILSIDFVKNGNGDTWTFVSGTCEVL